MSSSRAKGLTLLEHQPAFLLVSAHNTRLCTGQFYIHWYTPCYDVCHTHQHNHAVSCCSWRHVCRVLTVCILLPTSDSHAVDSLLLQLTDAGWPKDNGEGSELLHNASLDWPVTVLLLAHSASRRAAAQVLLLARRNNKVRVVKKQGCGLNRQLVAPCFCQQRNATAVWDAVVQTGIWHHSMTDRPKPLYLQNTVQSSTNANEVNYNPTGTGDKDLIKSVYVKVQFAI